MGKHIFTRQYTAVESGTLKPSEDKPSLKRRFMKSSNDMQCDCCFYEGKTIISAGGFVETGREVSNRIELCTDCIEMFSEAADVLGAKTNGGRFVGGDVGITDAVV